MDEFWKTCFFQVVTGLEEFGGCLSDIKDEQRRNKMAYDFIVSTSSFISAKRAELEKKRWANEVLNQVNSK